MTEPSHELWLLVRSSVALAAAGASRLAVSGIDQMLVLNPTWLPSFFQMRYELPDESLKMSGSMLPPPFPPMTGAPWVPSWHTTGADDVSTYGPLGKAEVATPMHWSPGAALSVAV
jgi:hypothetical protein